MGQDGHLGSASLKREERRARSSTRWNVRRTSHRVLRIEMDSRFQRHITSGSCRCSSSSGVELGEGGVNGGSKSERVVHFKIERETGGGNNGPLHHPFLGC